MFGIVLYANHAPQYHLQLSYHIPGSALPNRVGHIRNTCTMYAGLAYNAPLRQ